MTSTADAPWWWEHLATAGVLVPNGILMEGRPEATLLDVADHCAREAARIATETSGLAFVARCPGDPGFPQAVLHRVRVMEDMTRTQGEPLQWELLDMRTGLLRHTDGRLAMLRFYVCVDEAAQH